MSARADAARRSTAAGLAGAALAVALLIAVPARADAQPPRLRIGSKGFTEQYILAELVAAALERHAGAAVQRRLGLGGTGVCHAALVAGEIDLYVEYTGTGLLDVLRRPLVRSADAAYRAVSRGYRVVVPEECVADRHESPHFSTLYDLVLKYADVIPLGIGFDAIAAPAPQPAGA